MSWPLPMLLLVVGMLVVLSLRFLRWRPLSLRVDLAVTALLTLAVLVAIGLSWSVLWWLVQRWWA